jgi:hypothetical protein
MVAGTDAARWQQKYNKKDSFVCMKWSATVLSIIFNEQKLLNPRFPFKECTFKINQLAC